MKGIEKIILFLGAIAALAAAVVIVPMIAHGRVSNCGGNSAALSACQNLTLVALLSLEKTNRFDIAALSESNKSLLAGSGSYHWIPGAKILLRTNFIVRAGQKEIFAVCDKVYENVPQPTVWNGYRKNPAHAVGYSDGSTGLITPAQFKKLDLSGFIYAGLLLTNEVQESRSTSFK